MLARLSESFREKVPAECYVSNPSCFAGIQFRSVGSAIDRRSRIIPGGALCFGVPLLWFTCARFLHVPVPPLLFPVPLPRGTLLFKQTLEYCDD